MSGPSRPEMFVAVAGEREIEAAPELEVQREPVWVAAVQSETEEASAVVEGQEVEPGPTALAVPAVSRASGKVPRAGPVEPVAVGDRPLGTVEWGLAAAAPNSLGLEEHARHVVVPEDQGHCKVVVAAGVVGSGQDAEERPGNQVGRGLVGPRPSADAGLARRETEECRSVLNHLDLLAGLDNLPMVRPEPEPADTEEQPVVVGPKAVADILERIQVAEAAGWGTVDLLLPGELAVAVGIEVGRDRPVLQVAEAAAAVGTGPALAVAEVERAVRLGALIETTRPPASRTGGSYTAALAVGHDIRIACSGKCSWRSFCRGSERRTLDVDGNVGGEWRNDGMME